MACAPQEKFEVISLQGYLKQVKRDTG